MVSGVSSVPHRVPQPLSWSILRVDQLQLDSGLCYCSERIMMPVRLSKPLPHHNVEFAVGLEAENETDIVVISVRVDKEGAFEVNASKFVTSDGQTGVGIEGLQNFCASIQNLPIWILLSSAVGVESYLLKVVEVCDGHPAVVWAVVILVARSIVIRVCAARPAITLLAIIPNSVT